MCYQTLSGSMVAGMNSQLLYLDDVTTLEFDAMVRQIVILPDGRTGVILDRTYFYPTGGGQEHDTGMLGKARVLEVVKDETQHETVVLHVIDGELPLGPVSGKVDAERRLRHMQHHTAQHLLSQCFIRLFEIESISSNINGYTPSTLDLAVKALNRDQLDQIEDLANRVIFETRPVRTYFVTPEQLHSLPLRKPPKVSEDIRIVEIEGYDYTPCGGTHCTSSGQIGIVKIIKAERQGDLTRISFIAGLQALQYFREYQETVLGIAGQMSIHPQETYASVQRLIEQLKNTQREVQILRQEHLGFEARELAEKGEMYGSWRGVFAAFENRPVPELRSLAEKLKSISELVAVLSSFDGQKLSLVVTCAEGTGLVARDLLLKLLIPFGGRGGGDQQIAQGGGSADIDQFHQFPEMAKEILAGLTQP
jgi:alanyl-tRNA synthetase